MKTTLDIPDELYRQAKIQAAHENRKMKDFVSEGLRMALGVTKKTRPRHLRRMTKAPVIIRRGNVISALSNEAMAELLESSSERFAVKFLADVNVVFPVKLVSFDRGFSKFTGLDFLLLASGAAK